MEFRRLRPGELDHEALWLGVTAICALVAWGWLRLDLPRPGCVLHNVTGWPCPGCGSTRAVRDLLHGNLAAAFLHNPLFILLLLGAVLFDLYAAIVLACRLPRVRPRVASLPSWARIGAVSALLVNWLWLLWAGV